jgi:WD40 repeat protein
VAEKCAYQFASTDLDDILRQIIVTYDADHNGVLDLQEFKNVVTEVIGVALTPTELQNLFDCMLVHGQSSIPITRFISFFRSISEHDKMVAHTTSTVATVSMSSCGRFVALGGMDAIAAVYSFETGLRLLEHECEMVVGAVSIGQSNKRLLDTEIKRNRPARTQHKMRPPDVEFSTVAVGLFNPGAVLLLSIQSGETIREWEIGSDVTSIAWARSGDELAVAGANGKAVIFDAHSGENPNFLMISFGATKNGHLR